MKNLSIVIICCLFSLVNLHSEENSNDYEYEIQYEHDPMRPYLSSDKLALDTEHKYARCIRLQMGGYWDEIAKLYLIIANRGHPIAQLHLGKQYVHGNGVKEDYIEAYKWTANKIKIIRRGGRLLHFLGYFFSIIVCIIRR